MVPTRIAKRNMQASSHCFQKCGQVGSMIHIWWLCPKVTRFWIRAFNLIRSVTGPNISRKPESALFEKLDDDIPKMKKRLISYIILAARIAIVRCWNEPIAPN